MLDELDASKPGASERLGRAAITELSNWDGIVIRSVPDSQTDEGCAVAGAYIAEAQPAVLAVANSLSPGRRVFTLLHEFGHHLQQTRPELSRPLLDQPDNGFALEDAACNGFAAAILLPGSLVSRHIGSRGPTPGDVVALWKASAASRAAACVRASQFLPSPGHVLLLNADGSVAFDASHGLPPLRRGSDQSFVPVIRDALRRPTRSGTGKTRLTYRDAIVGDELYAQVTDMDGYAVAVLVIDHAPWEKFAPPSAEAGPSARWWTCEHCGETFSTFTANCARCGAPPCPECGRCNCASRLAERQCDRCFLTLPASAFAGASSRCKDCS